MGYTEDDQLAINTIRLLAVSYAPLKSQKLHNGALASGLIHSLDSN